MVWNQEVVSFKLFGKNVSLGTPHRLELVLLFCYAVFFLWWDVLQNKVLDLGTGYMVTWFAGFQSRALDLGIIILILFHIALMGLFLMSLRSKGTARTIDVVVAVLAFFGFSIVMSGFLD